MDHNFEAAQDQPWRYQPVIFPPDPSYRQVGSTEFKKLFHDNPGFYVSLIFMIIGAILALMYFLVPESEMLMLYIAGGAGFVGVIIYYFSYQYTQKLAYTIQNGDAVPAMLTDFTLVSNTKTHTDSKGNRRRSTDYWLEGAVLFNYQNEWYHWEFKLGSDTKAKKLVKKYYAGDIVTVLVDDTILMKKKAIIYQFYGIELQDEETRYIDEEYFERALTEEDPYKVEITKEISRRYQRESTFGTRNTVLNNIFGFLGNALSRTTGSTTDVEYLDILHRQAKDKPEKEVVTYEVNIPPPAPRYFKDYLIDEQLLPDYKKPSKFWIALIVLGLGVFALVMFMSDFDPMAMLGGGAIALVLIIIAIMINVSSKKKKQAAIEARKYMLLNGESCMGIITDIRIGRYEKYDEGRLINVKSTLKVCYTFVATNSWHQENFIITNENTMNQLLKQIREGDLVSVIYLENNEKFESFPVSLIGINFENEEIRKIPRADIVNDLARSEKPIE